MAGTKRSVLMDVAGYETVVSELVAVSGDIVSAAADLLLTHVKLSGNGDSLTHLKMSGNGGVSPRRAALGDPRS